MVLEPIECPNCKNTNVIKHGKTSNEKQRYLCKNEKCSKKTFIRHYSAIGRLPEVQTKILLHALNASGIRDTSRILKISPTTVLNVLKKQKNLSLR